MTIIKVLDAEVVKRIAAGETLQRPVNAVKELIENSLDAGSDRISVHVQVPTNSSSTETSAGLFSLQVTDNGSGIPKDDLSLLCERHATSKLVFASDLRTVGTFGFRGEALASCSQVARVEVLTRNREDPDEVAWKASYTAGKLTGDPTPVAGNFGTIVNVKDLFYGNRVRREALLNSSDEYQKIVQVIQAYALNQAGRCSFSLSRRRDRLEIQTSTGDDHVTVIKSLWNEEVGGAMLPFEIDADSGLGIESGSGGLATRTTFHKLKSAQVIIFLNGRLIEHAALRRSILQSFALHLPSSPPAHPFVYLNLRMKGSHVDVNVHPSKRQVVFLEEEEVIKRVLRAIDEWVLRRQYETQNLKPIVIVPMKRVEAENVVLDLSESDKKSKTDKLDNLIETVRSKGKTDKSTVQKISALYPSQRVLTDTRNHRMDAFLYHSSQISGVSSVGVSTSVSGWSPIGRKEQVLKDNSANSSTSSPLLELSQVSEKTKNSQESRISDTFDTSDTLDKSITLSSQEPQESQESLAAVSACELKELITARSNAQLSKLLQSSLVVGLMDSRWSLLQSGTNLLLCDTPRLAYELFFSLLSIDRKNTMAVDVRVIEVFEDEDVGREVEGLLREQMEFLIGMGIVFEECDRSGLKLIGLPSVLPGQRCPTNSSLRIFLHRLALLPSPHSLTSVVSELAALFSQVDAEEWPDWEEYVRFVVLAGMREEGARFTLRDEFRLFNESDNDNGADSSCCPPPVQIITNTETLYKSFERC